MKSALPRVGQLVRITGSHPWAGYTGRVTEAANVTITNTWHFARVRLERMGGLKVFVEPGQWEPFTRPKFVRIRRRSTHQ